MMNISRRTVLKIAGGAVLVINFLPRVAFAARNKIVSIRTGLQPGNKTRLVIETATRPSYTLSYPENKLVVTLANTATASIKPTLASGTIVKSIAQTQAGDKAQIAVTLAKSIAAIPKSQIMVLEPNGDSDYRLVLDFAAGTGASAPAAATSATSSGKPVKKCTIVIDPGHGGKDPGCIGKNGTREKTVVLSVAKKLRTKLDAAGFKTYITRAGDSFISLTDRSAYAEKHNADLFISIHANANPSRAMKGFSIYTLSKKASDEEAQKLADAENAVEKMYVAGFTDFPADIRSALSSLQQQALSEMSMEYASQCVKEMNSSRITQQAGAKVRTAPFAVLRASVPGALIEIGHLSNAEEEKLLNTDAHQNKLANAIVKSIQKYDFDV